MPQYLRDDYTPVNLNTTHDMSTDSDSTAKSDSTARSDSTAKSDSTTDVESHSPTSDDDDTSDSYSPTRIYRREEDPFDSAPNTSDDYDYGQGVHPPHDDDSGDDNGHGGDNDNHENDNESGDDDVHDDDDSDNDDDSHDDSDDDREGVEDDDASYDSYEDEEGDYLLPASDRRSDDEFTSDEVTPIRGEEAKMPPRPSSDASRDQKTSSEDRKSTGNDQLDSARRRDTSSSEEDRKSIGNDHSDSSPPSSLSLPSTASDSESTVSTARQRGAPAPSPERKPAQQQPWEHVQGTRLRSGRISHPTRDPYNPMVRGDAFPRRRNQRSAKVAAERKSLDDRCERYLSKQEKFEKWLAEQHALVLTHFISEVPEEHPSQLNTDAEDLSTGDSLARARKMARCASSRAAGYARHECFPF